VPIQENALKNIAKCEKRLFATVIGLFRMVGYTKWRGRLLEEMAPASLALAMVRGETTNGLVVAVSALKEAVKCRQFDMPHRDQTTALGTLIGDLNRLVSSSVPNDDFKNSVGCLEMENT